MGMHLLVGIGELENDMHTLSHQEENARCSCQIFGVPFLILCSDHIAR
jgi:hypothetical protein